MHDAPSRVEPRPHRSQHRRASHECFPLLTNKRIEIKEDNGSPQDNDLFNGTGREEAGWPGVTREVCAGGKGGEGMADVGGRAGIGGGGVKAATPTRAKEYVEWWRLGVLSPEIGAGGGRILAPRSCVTTTLGHARRIFNGANAERHDDH